MTTLKTAVWQTRGFRRAYKRGSLYSGREGEGGWRCNRTKKKCFKTNYIIVLIKLLFEFHRFFNFKTSGAG